MNSTFCFSFSFSRISYTSLNRAMFEAIVAKDFRAIFKGKFFFGIRLACIFIPARPFMLYLKLTIVFDSQRRRVARVCACWRARTDRLASSRLSVVWRRKYTQRYVVVTFCVDFFVSVFFWVGLFFVFVVSQFALMSFASAVDLEDGKVLVRSLRR